MFNIGDVVAFDSIEAGKRKFHLCISLNGHYLFINSPKSRVYAGDYITPSSEFPFLPPGVSETIISCSLVMKKTDQELKKCGARKVGSAKKEVILSLIKFIEKDRALSEATKDAIFDGLGDWM
jgi:hypothetical protein